jgi:hypothetical protein
MRFDPATMVPGDARTPQSLTVVVPTYRRPASLERCLHALNGQTQPPDQIVVACRTDDQRSQEVAASHAGEMSIEVVKCPHPRLVQQMNLGVAAATGDVVALTDDDSAPRDDWAKRLTQLYRAPDVGAVGGRDVIHLPTVDSRTNGQRVGIVTRSGRPLGNHHREGVGVRDVDFLKGVNLSIRRALWHVDIDLRGDGNQSHWELGTCLRIRRLGWRVVYDPELLVDHYPDIRVGEPQRGSRVAAKLEGDAHNELHELLCWLPRWQAATAAGRALLIGSKELPGVAVGAWLARNGVPIRQVVAEVRAATRGRLDAIGGSVLRYRGASRAAGRERRSSS